MAKYCPLTDEDVVYLECLECRNEMCRRDYEKERFYLFVGGSWFSGVFVDFALQRKKENGKQIILVSALADCREYAEKRGFIFRESTDPVSDCLLLRRKPDAGAIVFADSRNDQAMFEKIRSTGIRAYVRFADGQNQS